MIVGMIGISGYALTQGDLERIATKFDMQGQKCTGDFKYKLFTRLMPVRTYKNQYGVSTPV